MGCFGLTTLRDSQSSSSDIAASAPFTDPLSGSLVSSQSRICDSSGEVWVEWLTGDDGFEGGEQRHALLAEGGKVASEAGERIRAPV